MNRRRAICIVLLIGLAVIVQYALIKLQILSQTTYSALYFWLRPGVLSLGSVLAGVLLHLVFVTRNKRLSLPIFIVLGIVSLIFAFFTYVWATIPIPWPAAVVQLSQGGFASIISGVFLGGLLMSRIRRDEGSGAAVGQGSTKSEVETSHG